MAHHRPRSPAAVLAGVCLLTGALLLGGCDSGEGAPSAPPVTEVVPGGLPGSGPDATDLQDGEPDGDPGVAPDTLPGTTSGAASDSTAAPASGAVGTTVAPESTDAPATDRPSAPDFRLELGDGGEFALSEETRPVFLVFWAEW